MTCSRAPEGLIEEFLSRVQGLGFMGHGPAAEAPRLSVGRKIQGKLAGSFCFVTLSGALLCWWTSRLLATCCFNGGLAG